MNKETLVLKLIEILIGDECKSVESGQKEDHRLKGKPVIIRARDAGVHYGILDSVNGRTVVLKNSRRMYRWWAKTQSTLSAVAMYGLNEDKPIQIQCELDSVDILDACEIIPCSRECVDSFARVEPYNEQK